MHSITVVYKKSQIPTDLIIIGEGAYAESDIEEIVIYNGSIAGSQFANCTNLKKVTIKSEVISIGYAAFGGCTSLEELIIPFVGKNYNDTLGLTAKETQLGYLFGTIEKDGTYAVMQHYSMTETETYFIPTTLKRITVTNDTQISIGAFEDCVNLECVILPEGRTLTKDGKTSFEEFTSIGAYAFNGCTNLRGAHYYNELVDGAYTVEDEVVYHYDYIYKKPILDTEENVIDYETYTYSTLEEIEINHGSVSYEKVLREAKLLASELAGYNYLRIPSGTKRIDAYAFNNCTSLAKVKFAGTGLASISDYTFHGCSSLKDFWWKGSTETDITFDSNIVSIGNYAFAECGSINKLVIHSGITEIGDFAFANSYNQEKSTGLTDITLENNVIGNHMFDNCDNLVNVTIPASITTVGDYAFANCNKLSVVFIKNAIIGNYMFYNDVAIKTVDTIDYSTEQTYSGYAGVYYTNETAADSSYKALAEIGYAAFGATRQLASMTLPFVGKHAYTEDSSDNFEELFGYIFGHTESTETIAVGQTHTLDKNTQSVLYHNITTGVCGNVNITSNGLASPFVFYIPKSLKEVTIIDDTTIGFGAFMDICVETINFDTITHINDYAFYDADGLHYINSSYDVAIDNTTLRTIKLDGVTHLGNYAFAELDLINDIYLPSSITDINNVGIYTFANGDAIKYITFNSNVIGVHMFDDCDNLEAIKITSNVDQIGTHAFANNDKLVGLTLENEIIGEYMFYNCDSMVNVIIPDNITNIGYAAFGGCTNIEAMTLPFVGAHRYNTNAFEALFGYIFGHINDGTMHEIAQIYKDATAQNVNEDYNKSTTINAPYKFYIPSGLTSVTITDDTTIGESAFMDCDIVDTIILPDMLETIMAYAFDNCLDLDSINIPAGVSTIGQYAFKNCRTMTTITYNADILTTISEGTFYNCYELEELEVLPSIKFIEAYAFYNCIDELVTEVTVHSDVEQIGYAAFGGCINLTEMTLPFVGGHAYTESADDTKEELFGYIFGEKHPKDNETHPVLYTADKYDEYVPTKQLDWTFYIPAGLVKVTLTNTKVIGEYAFVNCNTLTDIILPDNLIHIKNNAFEGCNKLTSIIIPANVETIGREAFVNSTSLKTVEFEGQKLTTIEDKVFYNCSALETITSTSNAENVNNSFPDSITTIGNQVLFNNKNITEFVIGNNVVSMGQGVFGGCINLVELTIPFIGEARTATQTTPITSTFGYIFGNYEAELIKLNGNTSGLYKAVQNTNTYYLPTSLVKVTVTDDCDIRDYGFANANQLTTVILPADGYNNGATPFTVIGDYAFAGCTKLNVLRNTNSENNKLVELPNTTKEIQTYAFLDCVGLTEFTFTEDVELVDDYAFKNCTNLKSAVYTSNKIDTVHEGVFYNCITLGSFTFPTSVKTIESYAFFNNISMIRMDVPKNVTTINEAAFAGAHSLVEMTLPFVGSVRQYTDSGIVDSNTTFGYIFGGAIDGLNDVNKLQQIDQNGNKYLIPKLLDKIVITDDVAIGSYAFENCSLISSITLPTGYTKADSLVAPFELIDDYAFANCTELTAMTLIDTTKTIGDYAFLSCTTIPSMIITDMVTSIGDFAFMDCTNLSIVEFEDSDSNELTTMNIGLFNGCINLTTMGIKDKTEANIVEVPDMVTTIEDYVFYDAAKISTILVHKTMNSIGYAVFGGNTSLAKLTIPFIGDQRHEACDYNNSAINDDNETIFGYLFGYVADAQQADMAEITQYYSLTDSVKVYMPKNLVEVNITDTEVIHYGTFYNANMIKNVTLPHNLVIIEDYAFYNTTTLEAVNAFEVPTGEEVFAQLTTIGSSAFENATSLVSFNADGKVVIPSKVITLNNSAFKNCNSIIDITIPQSVGTNGGTIGSYVFANCDSLANITIENHWIGEHMFDNIDCFNDNGSKLESVVIPETVTIVDDYAFANNYNLTTATLENKVVGDWMFFNCPKLNNVVVPKDAEVIGFGAFSGCISLVEITIPFVGGHAYTGTDGEAEVLGYIFGDVKKYIDTNGQEVDMEHVVEVVQSYADNSTVTYYIPASLRIVNVTNEYIIGYGAFSNCSMLTNVTLPEGRNSTDGNGVNTYSPFESINNYAFDGCLDLVEITIPKSTRTIGAYAFRNNHSLAVVAYNGINITTIKEGTFYNCYSLKTMSQNVTNITNQVNVWDSVTTINAYAFYNNYSMTYLNIPKTVIELGYSMLTGTTSLDTLITPFIGYENLDSMVDDSHDSQNTLFGYFFGSDLEYATTVNKELVVKTEQKYGVADDSKYITYVPKSIKNITITNMTAIHYGTFYNCGNIVNVIVPNNLAVIEDYAFYRCLELVDFDYISTTEPRSLKEIHTYAFAYCSKLTDMVLPEVFDTLGSYAFYHDAKLAMVTFEGNRLTKILENTFFGCLALNNINSDNGYTINIPTNIEFIGRSAFENCIAMESVYIPNTMKMIDARAFYNASKVRELRLNEGLVHLGDEAFMKNTSLLEVTVPQSVGIQPVSTIAETQYTPYTGKYAFADNTSLTNVEIKNYELSDYMFNNAKSLLSVVIPAQIENRVGTHVFANSGITEIRAEDLLNNYIGEYMYYNNNDLENVVVPANITLIGYAAFGGCGSIINMTVPYIGAHVYTGPSYESLFGYVFGCSDESSDDKMYQIIQNYQEDGSSVEVTLENGKKSTLYSPYSFYVPKSLINITITGDSIVGFGAFENMYELENVVLPESTTTIGAKAFKNTGLISIVIPQAVTSIGYEGFMKSDDLQTVIFNGTNIEVFETSIFEDCTSLANLGVKASDDQTALSGCEIPAGIKTLEDKAFKNTGVVYVVIPENVITIGDYVFENSSKLTTVESYSNVTGKYMFKNSPLLSSVEFDNTDLTVLEEGLFYDCDSLCGIEIPESITDVKEYAFYNTDLTELNIPASVENIGNYAFAFNRNLPIVVIPANVKTLGYAVFSGNDGITSITLPFIGAYDGATDGQSLFGYIFGKKEYEGGYAAEQFMKDNTSFDEEGKPVLKSFVGVDYENGSLTGDYVEKEVFYIPMKLQEVNLTTLTTITNGAFSGLAYEASTDEEGNVVYGGITEVNLPLNLQKIETAAFDGIHALQFIEIPKRTHVLEPAVFADINPDFIITAFYNPDWESALEGEMPSWSTDPTKQSTKPAGWHSGKDIIIPQKWHTVYMVHCDYEYNIFIYEFHIDEGEFGTFHIIGFTEDLYKYAETHRVNGKFILRIPEMRASRYVVAIDAYAFIEYAPQNPNQVIDGIHIPDPVVEIGEDIIAGNDTFTAYIEKNEQDFGIDPTDWMGKGVVYYEHNKTWILADDRVYQILLSGTDISFDLEHKATDGAWDSTLGYDHVDLFYSDEEGYYLEYQGIDLTPKPIITSNAVTIGGAPLPTHPYENYDFQVEYTYNKNVLYRDLEGNIIADIATAIVTTNDSTVFAINHLDENGMSVEDYISLDFTIKQAKVTVTYDDIKTFEEDDHWNKSDWTNASIVGLKSSTNNSLSKEMLYGTYTTNSCDVKMDENGNVINHTSMEGEFNWSVPWTIYNEAGENLTDNYYLDMVISVEISPKKIVVYWANTDVEYNSNRILLPEPMVYIELYQHDVYNHVPLYIQLYSFDKVNKFGDLFRCMGEDNYYEGTLAVGRYLVVATTTNTNYILVNEEIGFSINAVTLETPTIYNTLVYNGSYQVLNVSMSPAYEIAGVKYNIYNYYSDPSCAPEYRYASYDDIVFKDAGEYAIYAKIENPDSYQWRDYIDPYFRSEIFELRFEVKKQIVNINIGNLTYSYDGLAYQFDIDSSMIEIANNVTATLRISALEAKVYTASEIEIVSATIDGEEFRRIENNIDGNNIVSYETDNYSLAINGTISVEYPELDVNIDAYEGEYDATSHPVVITTTHPVDKVLFSMDGKAFTEVTESDINTYEYQYGELGFTNAGVYTVYYRIECQNYQTLDGQVDVKIAKASTTINITSTSEGLSKVYDGKPVEVEYTVVDALGNNVEATILFFKDTVIDDFEFAIDAGNWTAKITTPETQNYKFTQSEISFVIDKANVVVNTVLEDTPYLGYGDNVLYEATLETGINGDLLVFNYTINKALAAVFSYPTNDSNNLMAILADTAYVKNTLGVGVKANYNIVFESVSVNITATNAIITFDENLLNKTYDGKELANPVYHTNTAGEVVFNYYELVDGEYVHMTSNPINAGTYKLEVSLAGDAIASAMTYEYECKIIQKDITLVLDKLSVAYNGTLNMPRILSSDSELEFAAKIVSGNGIDVATHTIKADLTELEARNYNISSDNLEFTYEITPCKLIISYTNTVYYQDNTPWTMNLADLGLSLISGHSISGSIKTISYEAQTYASSDDFEFVDLDIVDSLGNSVLANYSIETALTINIIYSFIEHTVTDATINDLGVYELAYEYDAKAHKAIVVPEVAGAKVMYSYKGKTLATPCSLTNVGTVKILYEISAPRYQTTTGEIEFKINKVKLDIEHNDPSKVYDRFSAVVTATVTPEHLNIKPTITYYNSLGAKVNMTASVGTYKAVIEVKGTANYDGISKEVEFEVYRAKATLNIQKGYENQIYDGEEVADPRISGGYYGAQFVIEYYEYSETAENNLGQKFVDSKPINAGKYVVVVSVAATSTYEATSKQLVFTIAKKEFSVSWESTHAIYNGEAFLPKAYIYNLDNEKQYLDVRAIEGDATSVGRHLVKAYLTSDAVTDVYDNYIVNNSELSILIDSRVVMVSETKDVIYTGDIIELAYNENSTLSNFVDGFKLNLVVATKTANKGELHGNGAFDIKTLEIYNQNGDNVTDNFTIILDLHITVKDKLLSYTVTNGVVDENGYYVVSVDYDKTAHSIEIIPDEKVTDYTIRYNVDGVWTTEKPEYTNAGRYVIKFQIFATGYETITDYAYLAIQKIDYVINVVDGFELSKIYDGKRLVPQIEIEDFELSDVFYTFRYYTEDSQTAITQAINAGKYVVEVLVGETDNYNLTRYRFNYEIFKTNSHIKVKDYELTKTYDGNPIVLTPEIYGDNDVTLTTEYYHLVNGSYIKMNSVPTNAGTYKVRFFGNETTNYYAFESDFYEIKINVKSVLFGGEFTTDNPYFYMNFNKNYFTLDIAKHNPANHNGIELGVLKLENGVFVIDKDSTYTIGGVITSNYFNRGIYQNASDFIINGLVVTNENGEDITENISISLIMSLFIDEAMAEHTHLGYEGIYDGLGHSITVNVPDVNADEYSIYYSYSENNDVEGYVPSYQPTNYSFTEVGTYKVYYKIELDNYKTITGYETVVITKATPSAITISDPSRVYNGFAVENPSISTNTKGEATYTYYQIINGVVSAEAMNSNPVLAGEYLVKVSVAETNNYLACEGELRFTIAKREININWGNTNIYYTGNVVMPKAVIIETTIDKLALALTIDRESIEVNSLATPYIASAVVDNENYIIVNDTCEFNIVKYVVEVFESDELTYSAEAYTIKSSDYYQTSITVNGEATSEIKNVGTYTVEFTLNDTANYVWSTGNSVSYTIQIVIVKANISDVEYEPLTDQTYTGTEVTPMPVLKHNSVNLVLGVDYTLEYENNVECLDESKIIVKGINNFEGELVIEFTIISKVFSIVDPDTDMRFAYLSGKQHFIYEKHVNYNSSRKIVLTGVAGMTTITEFLKSFRADQLDYISVYTANGAIIDSSTYDTKYMATGYILKLRDTTGELIDQVTVAVTGDLDGNGIVNTQDKRLLQRHIRGTYTLTNVNYVAADIDFNGAVDTIDSSLIG